MEPRGESSDATKSISLGCLFHDFEERVLCFLDLISFDDPRSSNSRIRTRRGRFMAVPYISLRVYIREAFIRVMKSIGKKKKEEREGEEKNGRTIEKKARRTSGGEVSRFFSPAFEIVLEVYTSRLTEKSSFRYLLKAIRHKTESTGPTRAPLPLSRSVR